MAELLVSVRSAQEAAIALAGGAAIIDVKEPRHGPLGRADDAVIAEVIDRVAGRCPVSAAFGELLDTHQPYDAPGLSYVKWGLAGCGALPDWPDRAEQLQAVSKGKFVFVAYADWQCAQAPPVDDVVKLACRLPGNVLLLDTCCKDTPSRHGRRPTSLDWLPLDEIIELCHRCHEGEVRVALAGSLGMEEIRHLRPARPTWFAVRGAACGDGSRDGQLQEERVRELVQLARQ